MDFAKKQLEKFGWKEGSGLGKSNQGIPQAIKPNLKVGKEGMGYDFSKELVDTWWTRAYDDSLNRINIEANEDNSEIVGVSLREDETSPKRKENIIATDEVERPFEKMRKRMMKATFTTFSKGATLSNGEMITESKTKPESELRSDDCDDFDGDSKKCNLKKLKSLTDEDLFKACGGRTAHKAARFGLKLNGKLARIAAQEEAAKALLSKSHDLKNIQSSNKFLSETSNDMVDEKPVMLMSEYHVEPSSSKNDCKDTRKKKKRSKHLKMEQDEMAVIDNFAEDVGTTTERVISSESPAEENETDNTRKRKKHKKRKHSDGDDQQIDDINTAFNSCDKICNTELEQLQETSSQKKSHKKKKSKRLRLTSSLLQVENSET